MLGFFNAVKWECILDIKEYLSYKVGLLVDFFIFTGTFIAIYYFGVNKSFASNYGVSSDSGIILVLIGYLFWQNACTALGYCTGTIANETAEGIFEVRLQSKYALESILFCRLLVSCSIHLITFVGIIGFGGIVTGYQVRDIIVILLSIVVSFPALIGMFGMGLALGSISICEKNVGSLILIVQTVLLFVTNTLSPSRSHLIYLIPFTSGIDIMRNIYLGKPIEGYFIALYIVVNLVWLLFGCLLFRCALKYEKTYGSFDHY